MFSSIAALLGDSINPFARFVPGFELGKLEALSIPNLLLGLGLDSFISFSKSFLPLGGKVLEIFFSLRAFYGTLSSFKQTCDFFL